MPANSSITRHRKAKQPQQASQPVRAASGRVVGHVAGDTFYRRAQASKHMLRAPRGWASDADILAELRAAGVVTYCVTDTETGTTYSAPLAEFGAHGVAFNRGFGPQVALPLGYWGVDGQPATLGKRQPDPDAPRQLPLFAEAGAP